MTVGAAAYALVAAKRRRTIRYLAAAASGIIALVYFLIGLGAVTVLDTVAGAPAVEPKLLQAYFGIPAALAFALGTWLLLAFDRRILWILGAILQVFVIYAYFDLAAQRTPAYESWGILIRIIQVMLLGALVYLVLSAERRARLNPANQ